jgi:tartrate dehydratase alpha subunit/fumarate hydratase class I-like protein
MPRVKMPPQSIDEIAAKANNDAPKSISNELQHVSIRLHPDLVRQLKEYAEREHRMFSETVRDLLLTGMRERGIK